MLCSSLPRRLYNFCAYLITIILHIDGLSIAMGNNSRRTNDTLYGVGNLGHETKSIGGATLVKWEFKCSISTQCRRNFKFYFLIIIFVLNILISKFSVVSHVINIRDIIWECI